MNERLFNRIDSDNDGRLQQVTCRSLPYPYLKPKPKPHFDQCGMPMKSAHKAVEDINKLNDQS